MIKLKEEYQNIQFKKNKMQIKDNEMTECTEKIISIVRQAGKIVLDAENIDKSIEEKSGTANFVTKYDKAVEDYLYENLAKAFPDVDFIGEESDNNENEKIYSGKCFIIDPIDGTTNFIHGYRHSAISVGLCEKGKMIAGVVYNPYLDEMFSAYRGDGAYLNGKKITVSDRTFSESLVVFGTSPYCRELSDITFDTIKKFYFNVRDVRRTGSAALDICYVACGRCDIYYEAKISPWDFAAGSVILEEAGGIYTTLDGTEPPLDRQCSAAGTNIAAREEFFKYINA